MGPFLFHDKLLPESCQNKMTTKRLSRNLNVIIGLSWSVKRLS